MKKYFIYITMNLINGKMYIGKHYGETDDDYLGSGTVLKRAINKYGRFNFVRYIIDFSNTEEENCKKEREYIALFNACESDMFYNIHEGGAGGNTLKGMSEEQKQKLKEQQSLRTSGENNPNYGKRYSEEKKARLSYIAKYVRDNSFYKTPEFKRRMSEVTSGKNNGMYNKHHTEESKKRMSENSKGKTAGEKNGMYGKRGQNAINGKPIVMLNEKLEPEKEFACKKEALKFLHIKGHIGLDNALKNKTLYKGYYWVYKD